MKGIFRTTVLIAILLAGITAALFLHPLMIRAADSDLPIYLEDSTILLKTQTVKGVLYLPLADIVKNLSLPYTNDTSQEAFTVRGSNSQVVMTRNSASISVNNQVTQLSSPVLHDNGTWLVPMEFLQLGLSRVTATEFRRRAGAPRVFAGGVKAAELTMISQTQAALTRLTLRTSTPVTLQLKRETAQHRAILVFAPKPVDPVRENLDFKDRLVQSINFNDSDGSPKVIVEVSDDVSDVRMLSADENRVHFVDFLRKTEATQAAPPQAAPGPAASAADPRRQDGASTTATPARTVSTSTTGTIGIRVIVIDPGHGGTDSGVSAMDGLEKDLTLAIARKLRTTLQSQLGATVLLTRDSDVPLTSEARAAVANNNRADLFVSLHIGYSANKSDLSSSVYVIQENFAAAELATKEKGQRLFLPWYLGYAKNRPLSMKVAGILSEELGKSLPGWTFPVRSGPVAVLASTTMPAILIEVGNLNNPASTQALLDAAFQTRFSATVAGAIERLSAPRQPDK